MTTLGDELVSAQSLLAIDFQGIYQVHVAAASERLAMLRSALLAALGLLAVLPYLRMIDASITHARTAAGGPAFPA